MLSNRHSKAKEKRNSCVQVSYPEKNRKIFKMLFLLFCFDNHYHAPKNVIFSLEIFHKCLGKFRVGWKI